MKKSAIFIATMMAFSSGSATADTPMLHYDGIYFGAALKRADGAIIYSGLSNYAATHLAQNCGSGTWCVINTPAAQSTVEMLPNGLVTASNLASTPLANASTVGLISRYSSYYSLALSGGKLYKTISATPDSVLIGRLPSALLPVSTNTAESVAEANALGNIVGAAVDGNYGAEGLINGIYFLTDQGNMYYLGKKPTGIQAPTSLILDDTTAATTPVLIRTGVSEILPTFNSTTIRRIGYVDSSGSAKMINADNSEDNISISAAMGAVSKVYRRTDGASVVLAANGVFAELTRNGLAIAPDGSGNKKLWLVPGISPQDVASVAVGANDGDIALVVKNDGSVVRIGRLANGLLGVTPVDFTNPNWKATVSATTDTLAGQVRLSITPPANAASLRIYRKAPGGSNTLITTVPGTTTTYDDTPPDGQLYNYTVIAVEASTLPSPASVAVNGRANVAPTSVGGSGTVVNGQSITFAPAIVDPNPSDTFTISIKTNPLHGTATVNAQNQIVYTSTSPTFSGLDTFQIQVADQLGNITSGNVTANVTCAAPTISGQSQDAMVEWGEGSFRVTYDAQSCHTNLAAKLELLDPITGAVTITNNATTLATGALKTLTFLVKDLPAKNYTAKLTFQSDQTAPAISTLSSPITVSTVTTPDVVAAKTSLSEDELASISVSMPVNSNCALTTDSALAQANRSYCLAEATTIPAGLVQEVVPGQLKIGGFGAPATNTPFAYQVSKWDSLGTKHVVNSGIVTMTFLVAPAPTFELFVPTTNVTALRDFVGIDLRQTSGANCQIFTDPVAADAELRNGARVCLATFVTPASAIMQYDSVLNRFTGRFVAGTTGAQAMTYKVERLYLDRPAVVAAQGTLTFSVTDMPAIGQFGVNLDKNNVLTGVDTVTAIIAQIAGEPCTLTDNAATAQNAWYLPGQPACLATWGVLPAGLNSGSTSTVLTASGIPSEAGIQAIPVTLSIVRPDGTIEYTTIAQADLTAALPSGPAFTFDAVPLLPGTTTYPVGLGGLIGKVTIQDDILGNVSMAVDTGAAAPSTITGLRKGNIRDIVITPGSLWSTKNVVLTSLWANKPTVTASKTITTVVVPPANMQAAMALPRTIINSQSLAVNVSVGQTSNLGLRYDAATMGDWTGYLGAVQADGSVTPLTTPVPLAGGKATITYPAAIDLENVSMVFVAEVQSQLQGYTYTLTSNATTIQTVNGFAITPTGVTASAPSGVIPFAVKLSAAIPTAQSASLGSVQWMISSDQGATWALIDRLTGAVANYTVANAGQYLVKAKTTNRYSGDIAYSNLINLAAYALPQLSISGKTVALSGTPAVLTANTTATNVKWEVTNPDGTKQTTFGATLTLNSNMPQNIVVAAMATNEIDPADPLAPALTGFTDPLAWNTIRTSLRFIELTPLSARVSGPKTLETGKVGTYTAAIRTPWDNAAAGFTLIGNWTLPDGTVVPGNTLDWTPTAADFTANKTPVFTAVVEGHEAATSVSVAPLVALKQFQWPTWALQAKYNILEAPANIRLAVVAPIAEIRAFQSVKEKATYTWTVPTNAIGAKATGTSASFIADQPGDYPVTVVVADGRGNTQTLTTTIAVLPPAPMTANYKVTADNRYMRAPTKLNLRPQFSNGHPTEKITAYRFFQDGVLLGATTKGAMTTTLANAGNYVLTVEADTTLGRTVTATSNITIVPNQAPTCTLTSRAFTSSGLISTSCTDADGRIKSYAWTVNGQPATAMGSRVTVPLGSAVSVTVTDDSGASIVLNGNI